ncbi:MAG: transposase [Deltaproteobacteria bacterium]|nr:transposase [Deltaproteobacteria bacterium]
MAALGAASIRSRIATGPEAGEPWRRLGDRVEPVGEDEAGVEARAQVPPRCVRQGGMSLHADVAVPARDRQRLERLCRYVARPPLALGRLEEMTDGRIAYRLKTPWRDGTTHVVMERRELLERLAPLIPPPRAHQVRYHGVLAPCASGRDRVVAAGSGTEETTSSAWSAAESEAGSTVARTVVVGPGDGGGESEVFVDRAVSLLETPGRGHAQREELRPRRIAWAELLKRVFEVDALRCPKCGGRMRLLAAITEASVAQRILERLALPPRAPPLATADAIEQGPEPDDRASEGTFVERQSDPGWEFDQSADEPPIEDEGA